MSETPATYQPKGPRVTPADIEAEIIGEHYFTAAQGVGGANVCADDDDQRVQLASGSPLHLLTFCVLVLRNGFTVTGESACASPENFDAKIGRDIARKDAVGKVWMLLGFRLRDKLASQPADYRDRMRIEASELTERMAKLEAFFKTDRYTTLSPNERSLMTDQFQAMAVYRRVLHERILLATNPN